MKEFPQGPFPSSVLSACEELAKIQQRLDGIRKAGIPDFYAKTRDQMHREIYSNLTNEEKSMVRRLLLAIRDTANARIGRFSQQDMRRLLILQGYTPEEITQAAKFEEALSSKS